jgi:hypothetical protein
VERRFDSPSSLESGSLDRLGRSCSEDDQREDDEADAAEQQRDPHDHSEQCDLLGHVADVQRRRERGLRHPGVAGGVRDRSAGGVLGRGCLVARSGRVRGILGREEPAHLRVGEPAGRLERVNAHVLGEAARVAAVLDRLIGDGACRGGDVLQTGLRHGDLDRRRVHVGRADDLLRGDLVADGVLGVDAHHERANTERDHERAGDDSADLENSATCHLLVPPV